MLFCRISTAMRAFATTLLGLICMTLPLPAQAPTTLTAMRGRYRPLLIFSGGNAKFAEQQMTEIAAHAAEARDRQVLLVGVQGTDSNVQTALLAPAEQERAQHRFGISPGQFVVILLGKDGGEKLRSSSPISWKKLRSTIDAMPMRQSEAGTAYTK